MTRHYIFYDVTKEAIVYYLKSSKQFGAIISASIAYHSQSDVVPHFHVVVKYSASGFERDPFSALKQCVMIDDIRCDEYTWRLYLSQNGKTPIIDI